MEKRSFKDAQQFDEERFTKVDMIKTDKSVAFMLNFTAGQHMKPHAHPHKELYLTVIEGNGTLLVDGHEHPIGVGDIVHCDSSEQMGFTNTSKKHVSLHVVMTKIDEN